MKSVLFGSILLVFSGAVLGSPTPEIEPRTIETVLYKRGDVLDKRGYELAALHGVDINKMYRHSLVKRSDEDDITIWVHNSYNETAVAEEDEDGASAVRERGVSLPNSDRYKIGWSRYADACGHSSFTSLTNPTLGAFTGGVHEIISWCRANKGAFHIPYQYRDPNSHEGMIIAGSNSGANACFMARKYWSLQYLESAVGTTDIADLSRDSLQFQRQYGTGNLGWRTAATGDMKCVANNAGETDVNWRLTSINRDV